MKVIIDRFEGDFAVVEVHGREKVDMPKILLPSRAKEGDIIEIKIDAEATIKRQAKLKELMNGLWV